MQSRAYGQTAGDRTAGEKNRDKIKVIFAAGTLPIGRIRITNGEVMKIYPTLRGAIPTRLLVAIAAAMMATTASAGQDANFILYNHHMEEKGALEVELYSDYGHVGQGQPNYTDRKSVV